MGIGLNEDKVCFQQVGIVPRAINTIFTRINEEQQNPSFKFKITVSFMELYNEELCDLLNNKKGGGVTPTIREDGSGKIVWLNLVEETVSSSDEILALLEKGTKCRSTGSTDMNATSSRSHAIFTITLSKYIGSSSTVSKFHFVDLAGWNY